MDTNNIKALVMDVDGTLTDGKLYIGKNGEEFKAFSCKDGCGISMELIPCGVIPVIITGRKSEILENRCRELGIVHLFQGVADKTEKLSEIIDTLKIAINEVAYIGDDLNDLPCMDYIKKGHGIIGCPKDASKPVKEIADYICSKEGGDGAVRDFIDFLLYDIK